VDLFLHSYSLRFHYLHKPGFDVFAFIRRAVADGFSGVNINLNAAHYRHLSGDSPDHIAAVRRALDKASLKRDVETSGTDPKHLETLLAVARTLGADNLRTYTRHHGDTEEQIALTARDLKTGAKLADILRQDAALWEILTRQLAVSRGLEAGVFFSDPANYRGLSSERARRIADTHAQAMQRLSAELKS